MLTRRKPREKRERGLSGRFATTQGPMKVELTDMNSVVEASPPKIEEEEVTLEAEKLADVLQEPTQEELLPLFTEALCNCEHCDCKENTEMINVDTAVVPVCTCVEYAGQDYFCPVHEPLVECPRCHCVESEIEILPKMVSIWNYRCKVCGIFYSRSEETGAYTHN